MTRPHIPSQFCIGRDNRHRHRRRSAETETNLQSQCRLFSVYLNLLRVPVLFVAAFRRGGQLSVLYPVYATTFIWAAVVGYSVYETPIKTVNIAGMALLIGGMCLMGIRYE